MFLISILHIFEANLEYSYTHCEKYPSKLDISRSLMWIFEVNLEYSYTRCEKYPSKLDISRSFITIFALLNFTKEI